MLRVGLVGMLIIQLTWGLCPDTATQTAERTANAVTLKFYRGQVDKWTSSENSAKVAVQISDMAQTICAASASTCGLENCCTSAFKETDVGTESGYPKNLLKDLELRIYVDLPTTINATASPFCVLSKSVVMKIVEQARDNIHRETGRWITYVDDEFYGIPPATDLNKIIIPIAFLIVFVIAGIVLGLNLWKKKKDADARRMKIVKDRKKNSKAKVQPTYNIEKNPEKDLGGVDSKTEKPEKPKRKDQLYKDNLKKKQSSSSRSSGTVVISETEPYQRQGYAYERKQEVSSGATGRDDDYDGRNGHGNSYPMKQMHRDGAEPGYAPATHLTPIKADSNPDTETSPEKKKKKKKKRSKSKENMKERDYENPNYYDDSDYRS